MGVEAIRTVFADAEDFPRWGEPDMSAARQNRRSPPPLPLAVFGPFWSDWIKTAAECASCPPDYVAGPLLTASAMLIGNSRWVSPWQGWKEPPVLWMASVGDPSSNKSPGADPVLDILRSVEREMASGFDATHREWQTARESARCKKESWERDVKEAIKHGHSAPIMPSTAVEPEEPKPARIVVSDTSPEKMGLLMAEHEKGLLMFRDELMGWLGNFDRYGGGGERAFWTEAYGGRAFTIDRVKHPLPIIIKRLSVGVFGGIQPDRLAELLTGADDGFQARFLWMWPDKVPPARPTRQADMAAALDAFRRLSELPLVTTDDGDTRPFLCPLADDAANIFDEWRREHATAEVSGALASAYGKAPGHVLRLALVLEYLWWCGLASMLPPPTRITKKAVESALFLIEEYFKPMAERVFGDAALPEADRLAATVARWILKERPTVINARELRRKARLPGLREAAKVKIALGALVDAEWLMEPAAPSDRGRPREDYLVNPKLWRA